MQSNIRITDRLIQFRVQCTPLHKSNNKLVGLDLAERKCEFIWTNRKENADLSTYSANGRNGAYGVNFGKQEHVMRKICKQFGVGRGRADRRGRTPRSIFVDAFFAASRRRRQRWRPHESRQKYETPIAPPPHRSWIPRIYHSLWYIQIYN